MNGANNRALADSFAGTLGAASRQVPVMQVLRDTDDHLQQLQHYGHSRGLREAMSAVQEMQDLLTEAYTGAFDANPVAHSNWLARVDALVKRCAE